MAVKKKMSKADILMAILFAAIIIIQAAQVFFRYFLNNSLVWAEELSRYIFSWLIMIGTVIAISEKKHIFIDLFISRLNKRARLFVETFGSLTIMVFSGFIAIVGFRLVAATNNTLSPSLHLPLNYAFYSALPVLSIFAFIVSGKNLIINIRLLFMKDVKEIEFI